MIEGYFTQFLYLQICECEALEETVASLKEQLSNASEMRISSQQAVRSSEGENLMTIGRNVDNENLRLLQVCSKNIIWILVMPSKW